MTLTRQLLAASALGALLAAPAFGQSAPERDITQYDAPQQCDCFFLRDSPAAAGTGRAEGGELTPREEITQYDQPAQCECFFQQGQMVIEDPMATGTIVVRRPGPLTEREASTLYDAPADGFFRQDRAQQ